MKKHDVMMVDDDTFTNELVNMVIEWTPFKSYFRTFEHPLEALYTLKKLHAANSERFPDYILLDLKMPEMDGFDFIREFENQFPERKKSTSFIIITSSILQNDKKEALDFESVKGYLIKPIPEDYIQTLITEGFLPGKMPGDNNQ